MSARLPTSWPALLTDLIYLAIHDEVRKGNGALAASIAAQVATGFYADPINHTCQLPASISEALNSGDGTYRP